MAVTFSNPVNPSIGNLAAFECHRREFSEITEVGQARPLNPGSLQFRTARFTSPLRPCMPRLGIGRPKVSECPISNARVP